MLDTNDELLTPEQVATETKVAKATLAEWRVRGGAASPPFVKMGKRVLYPRSKLRSWLAERLRTSTSDPEPANRAAESASDQRGTRRTNAKALIMDPLHNALDAIVRHLDLLSWHVKELRPSETAADEINGGMAVIREAVSELTKDQS